MYLATSAEMRLLDKLVVERFGLPSLVLMENAAQGIARAAADFWPTLLGRGGHLSDGYGQAMTAMDYWPSGSSGARVAILAGPGQNGGDGLALARIFSGLGCRTRVFLVQPAGRAARGDAAVNLAVVRKLGLPVEAAEDEAAARGVPFQEFDLVVDALFGTGLDRPVSGPAAWVLESLAQARLKSNGRLKILSVDLPSGLSADTGEMLGPKFSADLTVTLAAPKTGLYLKDGPAAAGKVVVGDIGLTPQMVAEAPPKGRLADAESMRALVPARPRDGHKGSFGHALVAGGAKGHTGALCLAAAGALRAGAGLVTALHPASLAPVFAAKLTEAMTRELPEDEPGRLSSEAGPTIGIYAEGKSALALGPGLGLSDGAADTVMCVARDLALPMVLDADALSHLAGRLEFLRTNPTPKILTPHPGEAARLLGVSVAEIESDRLGAARSMAGLSGAVVVLKGAHTVTMSPEGRFWLNPTGGPHLAAGGAGDLLTGLIVGLLAQKLPPLDAAALGVYVHGRAADLAAYEKGPFGLTITEISERVPEVWRELAGWRIC